MSVEPDEVRKVMEDAWARDEAACLRVCLGTFDPQSPPIYRTNETEIVAVCEMRKEAFESLERDGQLRVDPELVHPSNRSAYRLMAEAMESAGVGTPGTPIWLWTSWRSEMVCSAGDHYNELRCGKFHVTPGHVLVTVKLPAQSVLLSSYARWDFGPIRGFYLPGSDKDGGAFGGLLTVFGHNAGGVVDSSEFHPLLQAVARSSWYRVFDLSPMKGMRRPVRGVRMDSDTSHGMQLVTSEIVVQGVVAELRKDQVCDVVHGSASDHERSMGLVAATLDGSLAEAEVDRYLPLETLRTLRRGRAARGAGGSR